MVPTDNLQRKTQLTPGARAVLDAASALFYERGIGAVGVDAVAASAGVTKKTIYDRFSSKAALVCAYLQERDYRYRQWLENWIAAHPEEEPVLAVFDALESWMAEHGRQGCAFVHAHAELLSTPEHPAHEIIRGQKRWLQQKFQQLLEESGHQQSQQMATALLTLHEGATVLRSVSDFPAAISDARTSAAQLLP
ncbi:helix-turn-helix domain-containing protein [Nesterenkonia rhizosphaerae]|uniref:TetR/AcrR family transcriptional regulator n=1 Tax=Nesterenkonia rhizosphaerae TaxID=1348272 RepID=A0ABP9FRX1_9MICC